MRRWCEKRRKVPVDCCHFAAELQIQIVEMLREDVFHVGSVACNFRMQQKLIFLLVCSGFLSFYFLSSFILARLVYPLPQPSGSPLSLYIIPGGGSGQNISGYPEWTSRRTLAAYEKYIKQSAHIRDTITFLALSAGSLTTSRSPKIENLW